LRRSGARAVASLAAWRGISDGTAGSIYLPAAAFSEQRVSVGRGDITVTDLTHARLSRGGLRLQLHSLHGHVAVREDARDRA
jgi:hypothetical protein